MSEADYCDCDWGDYDPPAFVRIENVKRARKQYRCEECHGPIFVDESYEKVTGRWDVGVCVLRTCALCIELKQWATISVPCFCSITGELHERVQMMVKDIAPNLPGFFFEYGRRMVKIRQRGAISKLPTNP